MDEEQPQPLRAYGIVYRALESGGRAEWLLNFRGGAFLVDHPPALDEALDRGVWTEDPSASAGALQAALGTEDTVPMKLEVAPKIAVYVPPYAAPWDDAVRLALDFAEIPYRSLWDSDVLRERARRGRLAPPPPRGLHGAVRQVRAAASRPRPGTSRR